jgi:LysM repeat protein
LFSVPAWQIAETSGIAISSRLKPGDLIQIPAGGVPAAALNGSAVRRLLQYQMRQGDSLRSVAEVFRVPLSQIRQLNRLTDTSSVKPGITLNILIAEEP